MFTPGNSNYFVSKHYQWAVIFIGAVTNVISYPFYWDTNAEQLAAIFLFIQTVTLLNTSTCIVLLEVEINTSPIYLSARACTVIRKSYRNCPPSICWTVHLQHIVSEIYNKRNYSMTHYLFLSNNAICIVEERAILISTYLFSLGGQCPAAVDPWERKI